MQGHVKYLLCDMAAIMRGLGIIFVLSYILVIQRSKPSYQSASIY